MPLLTVFTPAYNRARTLPRLYESLLAQECTDFEWLIVDDGSLDDTAEICQSYTHEMKFPVRYLYKENGGKHTAYNLALKEATGTYFWCVDSDDLLAPDAIQVIKDVVCHLEENQGICSYKTDLKGNMLGGPFPEGISSAGLWELTHRYGRGGEFALTFPTEFAKRFPFPVFKGEHFVTESVIYDRMEREQKLYLLPKVTNICEYQQEGYSNNIDGMMKRNPSGYCLYYLQRIDMMVSFAARAACAGKYWCFRSFSGQTELRYAGDHRLFVTLSRPLGLVFQLYYKLIRKF